MTEELLAFVEPFYRDKDIMHDLSHIQRMLMTARNLRKSIPEEIDWQVVLYAAYFHGFIYKAEDEVIGWLRSQGLTEDRLQFIVRVAWDSGRPGVPETLEGKLLHDAHMVEGGKTYLVVKSLITGSLRGQTLEQTIDYIETNLIGKGHCYLPEAVGIFEEQQRFAVDFISELKEGIGLSR